MQIEHDELSLNVSLEIPADAIGLVLFAHGNGSSRFSARNRRVASQLRAAGLGTLLFELLAKRGVIGCLLVLVLTDSWSGSGDGV